MTRMPRLLISLLGSALVLSARLPAQQNTVDPHASADLIAQVNALAAACNGNCAIHIPAGEYTVHSGTIHIDHAGLSLLGEGRGSTIIHYTGPNFLDARLNAATYAASSLGGGTIGGFTVQCTNPQVRCITGGSILNERFQDLTVTGPGGSIGSPPPGSDAQGFVFQNDLNWMERTIFRDIQIGGFNVNFHFMKPLPGGTNSFGYTLFDGIWTNQSARSHNFVVDPGAGLYNTLGFTLQFNAGGTSAADEVFTIGGAFTGVGFHVTGENAGAPITFAHIACSGGMVFSGDYNIFFGGVIADCPQDAKHPGEPFRISPAAGLGAIAGSLAGNPVILNFAALGLMKPQTLQLWPYDEFSRTLPNAIGYTGFVRDPAGGVSPLSVYDYDLPWCVSTRRIYSSPDAIVPRLCLDGPGNLTITGTLRDTSIITTRKTPASSHEACTPGESWDDDDFHYHCTSTGQIKRLALAPF